jgi:signal transduction histidine kinase
MKDTKRALAFVFAGGAVAVALTAVALKLPATDSLLLAGYAGLGALIAGLAGVLVMNSLRTRSIAQLASVAAITTVGAVALGAVVASQAMFISSHDLSALALVLVAGGTIGVAFAVILGQRVSSARRSLAETTRRIGAGDFSPADELPAPAEFTALAQELERMSERLQEAQERERSLEASRRELVAWVSHDLRTPLAGIRAMAEALEDGVVTDDATVARYHVAIRNEVDRLSGLVDDLFELSRINAGSMRLELERVSLGDLVSDALSSASGIASAKGVRLQGALDGRSPELELSAAEMGRVLRNVLENAIRHTPSDGVVRVDTGVELAHAYVRVADECGGIAEDDIDRVFEAAFRGEAARTPGDGSGGLGLAIARGIVEAHEGEISVRNFKRGCAFTIRLPMHSQVDHEGHD